MSDSDDLVSVFMPGLGALLISAEDKKGTPLTRDEVTEIRDNATCIMMKTADAQKMIDSRGYSDIDPENCWYDWQMVRQELGRKPDLEPGLRVDYVRSGDSEYQKTIHDAHESLSLFREMLHADGTPRWDAMIKTKLTDGDNSVFMWLSNTVVEDEGFSGELFEVPDSLPNHKVGDRHIVTLEAIMDWMVNEDGRLSGGYSLRYHRAGLSDVEKIEFDRHIGVTEYL